MNYEQALEFIHGVNHAFCKPGLERISALCDALGNPERDLKFIHVAGTNGKGSTSSMLSYILKESGYRVGLYTSPYIYRFNERMAINNESISDDELVRLTEKLMPIVREMDDKPTEFELITAMAFLYFKESGADVVVLEVGMGGRFDSTNVIDNPYLSIITGISLDHTAFLGDTVEKIAYEKAGIIKSGSPVLYCGDDEAAFDVIKRVANEKDCRLYRTDRGQICDTAMTLEGGSFSYKDWKDVKISLLGEYQFYNCAGVLEAVEILRQRGLNIDTGAVYRGLNAAKWRARFEIVHRDPTVIFDGAHNPEGIFAAVESIKKYYDRKVCVFSGVLKDKDYNFVAKKLSEVAGSAYTVTPDNPRALGAEEYASVLRGEGVDAHATASVSDAIRRAIARAKEDRTAVCCLGSLYTYRDVIDALRAIDNK